MATTIPPTSLAPTTLLDLYIDCDPISIRVLSKGIRAYYPDHGRDTNYDIELAVDPVVITITPSGGMLNLSFIGCIITITVTPTLVFRLGVNTVCDPIVITILPSGRFFKDNDPENWVAWSKIGDLSFLFDHSNVAGERQIGWSGTTFGALKLGKTVAIYGENGVSLMAPSGVNWGMETIHRVGVLSKGSVAGDEFEHFFIDKSYKLMKLSSEGVVLLDYSEYLSKLVNPVMSLDISNRLIYICDGTSGFVYSILTKSFGEGPSNITGAGYRDGGLYVIAPESISIPKFSICTDIYDFGSRKPKTIQVVEVGTDLTNNLEVRIEARISNKLGFISSKWVLVNPNGIATIPCFGIEFRFRLRSYIYEYFEIDYIKVSGNLHEYSPLGGVR